MLGAVADRALDPEAVWGKFAVDSLLEEEGYEPSVPVEDGSFSSLRSSVQGPALPQERSSIPQKRRGHSGVRYMGFAALNPAASRALAIERGGEGFSIRRFDGAQLGEKAFLILTRRNAVGPLCRGLALTQFPGRELRTRCSKQPGIHG